MRVKLEPPECFSVPGYRCFSVGPIELRKKDPFATQAKRGTKAEEPQPNFNNRLFKITSSFVSGLVQVSTE